MCRSLSLLLWLVGRAAVQGAFSILAARTLGAADFGAFGAALSLAAGLTPWLGWGLTTVMVQRVATGAKAPERELRLCLQWYLRSYPLIAAFGLGLVLLLLHRVCLPASLVMMAELTGGFIEPVLRLAQGTRNFHRMGFLGLGQSAARLLAVLLALGLAPGSLEGFCWCYLLTLIGYAAIFLIGPLKTLTGPAMDPEEAVPRPREGLPFSVMATTLKLNADFDKTVLVWSGQNGAAGNYSAAYRLTDLVSIPVVSVIETAVPSLFAAMSEGRSALFRRMTRLMTWLLPVALLCGAALYLAAPAALWLYGDRYPEVPTMLRALCALPLVFSIWLMMRTTAMAANLKVWCMTVECAATSLSMAALFFAVPQGGWRAAVAVTYASYLCMAAATSIGLFRARSGLST